MIAFVRETPSIPKVRVVARVHDAQHRQGPPRRCREIVSPDFTGGMRHCVGHGAPHVVGFMDQMLHSDEGLRVEEVVVPGDFT